MSRFNYHKAIKDTGEILDDKKIAVEHGKYTYLKCKWQTAKKQSKGIADGFKVLEGHEKRSEYIANCAEQLGFSSCPNGHYKKLKWANFCGQRLCPICQWRRSLKTFGIVSTIYQHIEEKYNPDTYKALMVTLTIRNCKPDDLKSTNSKLLSKFARLFDCTKRNLPFPVRGYFRALEVTYNRKKHNFHPHIHALILVSKKDYSKYFAKKIIMETQNKLSKKWAKLLGEDVAFCHIQRMYNSQLKMIAEVAKYATKPSSYIKLNKDTDSYYVDSETLKHIHDGVFRLRLTTYGGLFKDVKKELALQDADAENADLINVDEKQKHIENCPHCQAKLQDQLYKWNYKFGVYIG